MVFKEFGQTFGKTVEFLTGTAVGIPLPGAAAARSRTVVFDASTEGNPQTVTPEEAPQEANA